MFLYSAVYLVVLYQTHILYYHYLLVICTYQMYTNYQCLTYIFTLVQVYIIDIHEKDRVDTQNILLQKWQCRTRHRELIPDSGGRTEVTIDPNW